jgi:hypothetical protein
MLPFFLYFVTGLVTGFHICILLSLALYGAPANPFELLALLGSFCLLIAAYLSLYQPYIAARVALLASLAVWSFYGPAIANLVRTKLAAPRAVSSDSIRCRLGSTSASSPDGVFQLNSTNGAAQRDLLELEITRF